MSHTSASKFMVVVFKDKALSRFWDDVGDQKQFILWLWHISVFTLLLVVLHWKAYTKKIWLDNLMFYSILDQSKCIHANINLIKLQGKQFSFYSWHYKSQPFCICKKLYDILTLYICNRKTARPWLLVCPSH